MNDDFALYIDKELLVHTLNLFSQYICFLSLYIFLNVSLKLKNYQNNKGKLQSSLFHTCVQVHLRKKARSKKLKVIVHNMLFIVYIVYNI